MHLQTTATKEWVGSGYQAVAHLKRVARPLSCTEACLCCREIGKIACLQAHAGGTALCFLTRYGCRSWAANSWEPLTAAIGAGFCCLPLLSASSALRLAASCAAHQMPSQRFFLGCTSGSAASPR